MHSVYITANSMNIICNIENCIVPISIRMILLKIIAILAIPHTIVYIKI